MNPDVDYRPATPEQVAEMRRLEAVLAALCTEVEQLRAGAELAGQAGLALGAKDVLEKINAADSTLAYLRERETAGDYWARSADRMARSALRWER